MHRLPLWRADADPDRFSYTDDGVAEAIPTTEAAPVVGEWYRFVAKVHKGYYDLYIYNNSHNLMCTRTGILLQKNRYVNGPDAVAIGGVPYSSCYYDLVFTSSCDVPLEPAGTVYSHYSQGAGTATATTTYTYDDYNKLTGIANADGSTETLTYDSDGQLTLRQKYSGGVVVERTDYSWDDRGLLTRVKLPAADGSNPSSRESVWYTYDGAGRLIGRKDADGAKSFVQTGWDIVEEVDEITKEKTFYTGASMIRESLRKSLIPFSIRVPIRSI